MRAPYASHVLIHAGGYNYRATDATRWLRVLDTYEGPTWRFDRIRLVRSRLGQGPGGRPRYETAAELPLGHGSIDSSR